MMRLRIALAGLLALAPLCAQTRLSPLPAADRDPQTGPAVGARIPSFEAVDQNGKRQTFDSLRGPHGLALLFVRSADW